MWYGIWFRFRTTTMTTMAFACWRCNLRSALWTQAQTCTDTATNNNGIESAHGANVIKYTKRLRVSWQRWLLNGGGLVGICLCKITYRYECRCVFSCHFSGEIVCHNTNMDTVAYRCVLTNALTVYLISWTPFRIVCTRTLFPRYEQRCRGKMPATGAGDKDRERDGMD